MGKILTTEEIKNFVESCNYKFIDRLENVKGKIMIVVECPNGHENSVRYNNFKNRNGCCKDCQGIKLSEFKRKSTEEIMEIFNSHGFAVISGLEKYKNNRSKLQIECINGHKNETCLQHFQIAKQKCIQCNGRIILTINNIKSEFNKRNYILLEDTYADAHTKMKYICNEHPKKIRKITWNNFNSGKGCRDCATKINSNNLRLSFSLVEQEFKKKNYTLVSKSYRNTHDHLEYICKRHEDLGIQHVSYSNLKITLHNCQSCKDENVRRGEEHYKWAGGISTLSEHLRKKIDSWKKDSMEASSYKCVVTGEKFDVIHHLYSFNKIVSETLEILKFKVHTEIHEYTTEELYQIQKVCLDLHFEYGLGVCLSNEIHDLFHKIYGKYDNTPEQFKEFKLNYQNGKYNT